MSEHKEGVCPECGEEDLDYSDFSVEGDGCYYLCKCDRCGWKGREWYDMKFMNYTDEGDY